MRARTIGWSTVAALSALSVMADRSTPARAANASAASMSVPDLEWPLPAAERALGAIDGRHLWQYVLEQAQISRRYRDQGHAQFWGRIIGSSADAEDARWLAGHFTQIGLSEVHIQ